MAPIRSILPISAGRARLDRDSRRLVREEKIAMRLLPIPDVCGGSLK
jgi:hypothetical protein